MNRPGGAGERHPWKPAPERRKEILEAAVRLFGDKGYDETAVQEIAAQAGVAAGTVYLYYSSKEHILLAIHEHFHEEIASSFGEVVAETLARVRHGEGLDYREVIDHVIDTIVSYVLGHRTASKVVSRYMPRLGAKQETQLPDREFVQVVARILEAAVSARIVHTSDPEVTARLLNTAFRNTVGESLANEEDPSELRRIVQAAKELFHKALAPVEDP